MIAFISKISHDLMWVADDRAEEYKAAGYKLAADDNADKPTKEVADNGVRNNRRRTSSAHKTAQR